MLAVAAHLPDREAHLDVVVHALQRRPRDPRCWPASTRAIEWKGWRRWAFPLLVIGANSIAIYVMSWTIEHFVTAALVRHLGTRAVRDPRRRRSSRCCAGAACCSCSGSILYWMYRRKIFLRI